jgi:serine/threonine-protein kinase
MGAVSVDQRAPIGPLPVGAKLKRYEILGKLAAGGMAIVYVARAQGVAGFERLVAIKVLHSNLAHEEEFIKMFLDEARLAASIRHPNVVPTIDISDTEKSGYFIVMEYIEGDHLGQLLSSANKAAERLPIPVTVRIICDALGGLGAAHDLCDEQGKTQNLVHRDVSPHNIMVGRDGVARLTDFGVAKAEDRLTHTRDGQVKGKLAYMAPEQAASGTTDTRSDLFSMGVILWECLTGQRLLRAESTAATLHKLLHGEIPKLSTVVADLEPLDAVLEKALARDPDQRFPTAEAFARSLEDASGVFGGAASLREVGRVVKHHAAAKLKRDKKLIDEALKALRPAEVAPEAASGIFTDETSSPTSPSSSEISIVAGSPSLISKVSNVLAADTMPGTRRATRRTLEVPVPDHQPPPPLGAAEALPSAEPDRAVAPPAFHVEPAVVVAPELRADASLQIEIESVSTPGPEVISSAPSGFSDSPRANRRLNLAVLLLGVAALTLVALWAGSSSQEVVQVEEMGGALSAESLNLGATSSATSAVTPHATAPIEPATTPAAVATIPAITATVREDINAQDAPRAEGTVNTKAPAAQAFVPVVSSAASSAASAASAARLREAAGKSTAKPAVRRHREVKPAAPRYDVIPNPYHD